MVVGQVCRQNQYCSQSIYVPLVKSREPYKYRSWLPFAVRHLIKEKTVAWSLRHINPCNITKLAFTADSKAVKHVLCEAKILI